MEKVNRDGMIAVAYSPKYGAGWFTMTGDKRMLFHPSIIHMIEGGNQGQIDEDWLLREVGVNVYCGGAKDLKIEWIPEGTAFEIEVFDGREEIKILGSDILVA